MSENTIFIPVEEYYTPDFVEISANLIEEFPNGFWIKFGEDGNPLEFSNQPFKNNLKGEVQTIGKIEDSRPKEWEFDCSNGALPYDVDEGIETWAGYNIEELREILKSAIEKKNEKG